MWDTCSSHFGPKKFDRVGRVGQGRSKYGPGLAYNICVQNFLLWSPLGAPKWVKDPGNGLKSIGGTFLGLVVMLSCCNVIMACFNLHLAVCDVRCLRFTGIQEKCMEDQKLHEYRLLVLCQVFKKIQKCREHRKLHEQHQRSFQRL